MPAKNLTYTKGQQEKINLLHEILNQAGIDTSDPKHPGAKSDSALFRWLVEQELQRRQPAK